MSHVKVACEYVTFKPFTILGVQGPRGGPTLTRSCWPCFSQLYFCSRNRNLPACLPTGHGGVSWRITERVFPLYFPSHAGSNWFLDDDKKKWLFRTQKAKKEEKKKKMKGQRNEEVNGTKRYTYPSHSNGGACEIEFGLEKSVVVLGIKRHCWEWDILFVFNVNKRGRRRRTSAVCSPCCFLL